MKNNVLALAAAVVDPSYVGAGGAAASFHSLTTQKADVNSGCHVVARYPCAS